jgi:NAD(P)-dependent dehydrogenase (short-subunit alcohol dehydrogenase family)
MEIRDAVVVVTGAGSGIGAALCRAFAAENARGIVVADRDPDAAAAVAAELEAAGVGALALGVDAADPEGWVDLVARTRDAFGPIDLLCSNAGIGVGGGVEVADADWDRLWRVNVMSHVYAVRAVLPDMRERGGHVLITASAAGLLADLGSLPYTATKHAAVGLAEWLAVTHHDEGVAFSCLCPQVVDTPLGAGAFGYRPGEEGRTLMGPVLSTDDVAAAVVEGLLDGRFLILPHPEVAIYLAAKGADHPRWLSGMRRLRRRVLRLDST